LSSVSLSKTSFNVCLPERLRFAISQQSQKSIQNVANDFIQLKFNEFPLPPSRNHRNLFTHDGPCSPGSPGICFISSNAAVTGE
jgi:hypothetical protein